MSSTKILKVKDLSVSFKTKSEEKKIINSISFDLNRNEILGLVGESGSGKSISSLAIMGLLPKKISRISSGSILYNDKELTSLTNEEFRPLRGNDIAMIFQEPMSSLNPSIKCGYQIEEILFEHTKLNKIEVKEETLALLEKVKLPHPKRVYNSYPHEISGGQKQRVMIAMAIACKPNILIADEPTTALDVTVQREIILLLKELQKETQMSVLFISHDLALVSEIADRVLVMYNGEIVEQGNSVKVFKNPEHIYTQALVASKPSYGSRLKRLPTIKNFMNGEIDSTIITQIEREKLHKVMYSKPPLLEVVDLEKEFFTKSGWMRKPESFKAVNGVSFKLYEGETLGLVGESGCGKSTLSNAILFLDKATSGLIYYKGNDITKLSEPDERKLRKEIQIIFQDPYASLNPRIPIGKAILEPMLVHNVEKSKSEAKIKVLELLTQVGLSKEDYNKYPHEFSGGQRQRIGIARAIALKPKLIICDESVSALDISVQAQVLNLLNELKEKFNFTYIFISHDLSVVKYMSDQLLVMNNGEIEEIGDADDIYMNPKKEYTSKLINAIPKGL